MANKILTPREFIKEKLGEEITWDNESDSCDYEWTIIEDLMLAYADYLGRALAKPINDASALPIHSVSGMCECKEPIDAGSDYPDVFHKCSKCGLSID